VKAEERRLWPRFGARECDWLVTFRLYPGSGAVLVNLSRGGALVEGRERFAPGSWLQIKIVTASELLWGRARVVRCEVAELTAHTGARYRTAVGFERALILQRLAAEAGYPIPDPSPTPPDDVGTGYPESR